MTRDGYASLLLVALAILLCLAAASLLLRVGFSPSAQPARGPARSPLPGVTLDRVATPEGPRLIVTSLRGGAPPAGLAVGDRIEDVGGARVTSLAALRDDLRHEPADPLEVHVRRNGRILAVAVMRETAIMRDTGVVRETVGGRP